MTSSVARVLLALICLIGCAQAVDAKALIRLSWRKIEIEESPRSQTHISHSIESYTLDGNTVMNGGCAAIAQLGHQSHGANKYGIQYNIRYTVKNGSISITLQFSGLISTRIITTDVVGSCSASIDYHPLPGKDRIFERRISDHSPMVISALYADQISCSIGQI